MKCLTIALLSLLLAGCEKPIKNPQPADVEGTWESLSIHRAFPYSALKFDGQGNGKIVLVDPDFEVEEATLKNFVGREKYFDVTLVSKEDPTEEELWQGTVSMSHSQLCFTMTEPDGAFEEDLEICFTRSDKIDQFRELGLSTLNQE